MKFFRKVLLFTVLISFGFTTVSVGATPMQVDTTVFANIDTAVNNGITITGGFLWQTTDSGLYLSAVDYAIPSDDDAITLSTIILSDFTVGSLIGSEPLELIMYPYNVFKDATTLNGFAIKQNGDIMFSIESSYFTPWGSPSGVTSQLDALLNSATVTFTAEPVDYTEPDFQGNFITLTGAWLVGIWAMVNVSILASIEIFYDSTPVTGGMTIIGILALFGLAFTLTTLGLTYVSRMIKK